MNFPLINNAFITSMIWFGNTVIYSTERHALYLTQDKQNQGGILFSFNCSKDSKPNIIVNALSDRVIIASNDPKK
jgi:hypothetical protein